MFPIRSERDTKIVDWVQNTQTTATTQQSTTENDLRMVSTGVLNVDHGLIQIKATADIASANTIQAIGLHITPPVIGDEHTLYSYNAHAWCVDPELMPFLFIAVSPASITNNVAGDVCVRFQIIGTPDASSDNFISMQREGTIAVPQTHIDDRSICFGIGFATGVSACTALKVFARLSVRRLVANKPTLIDTTKL